ncbi:MAG: high-potential iron-sulfur protein [Caldimonas sp.]
MTEPTRRTFMLHAVSAGVAVATSSAHAQTAGAKLDEADPQAVALGYKVDTAKVDGKKYPNHVAAQDCANCQLYQGKAKDPTGPCPLFAGKPVAAGGWCSAWNKKTA